MNKKCFLLAFKTSIPVLFGYLAIGIAFGLLVVENDYPWWIATVMSISMYAGAGQYIAIGLSEVHLGQLLVLSFLLT